MARGVNTLVDDLDFYVETRDSASAALTITATASTSIAGATLQNTGPGGIFYVTFTSIGSTCTCRLSWQGKDPVSGLFYTFASLSLDGLSVTNTVGGQAMNTVYITGNAVSLGYTNVTMFQFPMPRVFRVYASITVNSTASNLANAGLSMNVGYTRLGGL